MSRWELNLGNGAHSTSERVRSSSSGLHAGSRLSGAQPSGDQLPSVFARLTGGSYSRTQTQAVASSSNSSNTPLLYVPHQPPLRSASSKSGAKAKIQADIQAHAGVASALATPATSTVQPFSLPALASSSGLIEYTFSGVLASDPGWYRWENVQAMPQESPTSAGQIATFSVPDLHGNAFRLIIYLYKFNFITLDERAHNRLRDLYVSCGERQADFIKGRATAAHSPINDSYLSDIRQTLSQFLVVNPRTAQNARLILIGDIFYDRGNDDIMMLELLRWMTLSFIQYTIILSNHDLYFLQCYENGFMSASRQLDTAHYISTLNLIYATQPVKQEMQSVVRSVYIPNLRLLDYDWVTSGGGAQKIYLYTHTPFLESLFNLVITDLSAQRLMTTAGSRGVEARMVQRIDNVNLVFQQQISSSSGSQFFTVNGREGSALSNFVWNRTHDGTLMATKPYVTNLFGHMGTAISKQIGTSAYNLDYSSLGRPNIKVGELLAFRVTDGSPTMFHHFCRLKKEFMLNAVPWQFSQFQRDEQCEFLAIQRRFHDEYQDVLLTQQAASSVQRRRQFALTSSQGHRMNEHRNFLERSSAPIPNSRPRSGFSLPNATTLRGVHAAAAGNGYGSIHPSAQKNNFDDDGDAIEEI